MYKDVNSCNLFITGTEVFVVDLIKRSLFLFFSLGTPKWILSEVTWQHPMEVLFTNLLLICPKGHSVVDWLRIQVLVHKSTKWRVHWPPISKSIEVQSLKGDEAMVWLLLQIELKTFRRLLSLKPCSVLVFLSPLN